MTDIIIRKTGCAGHITLSRPDALNALTWDMCLAIEGALDSWCNDPDVALVLIDAAGTRAFCAGGDIAQMYAAGQRGELEYGRRFWRDEYRLNAKLYSYPKPTVSFLHGFTMGGGVGVGCHAAHRIVCDSSRIAMPECTIGLVPDVGGSLILAKAPGYCGTYLGLSGDRMDAGDAIYAGFADHFIPQEHWDDLKAALITTADVGAINAARHPAPTARLAEWQADIDHCFAGGSLADICRALPDRPCPAITHVRKLMAYNAPLAMAVTVKIIQAARDTPGIKKALDREFRYTYRCITQGDFIEGIRAAIIDRDRTPRWQHSSWDHVPNEDVAQMTRDLGQDALQWEEST
ncbi:enoyl-CoA hydratase/carnithine racemase [Yoonia maricola]|uniref:3-hydroxyisobutyryl-CoA hydrolase n=1 Tax=Yoonia maricola TaxID=420999 RepID=A0A2M8WKW8_9RHOB|nr:enoyl-CoA hydratase/isomerase family protein [Yoonia maricola]PJI91560.1 enoyl-CoA hydratase/carnithine racemase [Yoonia maricola]